LKSKRSHLSSSSCYVPKNTSSSAIATTHTRMLPMMVSTLHGTTNDFTTVQVTSTHPHVADDGVHSLGLLLQLRLQHGGVVLQGNTAAMGNGRGRESWHGTAVLRRLGLQAATSKSSTFTQQPPPLDSNNILSTHLERLAPRQRLLGQLLIALAQRQLSTPVPVECSGPSMFVMCERIGKVSSSSPLLSASSARQYLQHVRQMTESFSAMDAPARLCRDSRLVQCVPWVSSYKWQAVQLSSCRLRLSRSEERRVGKRCKSRWSAGHGKRK